MTVQPQTHAQPAAQSGGQQSTNLADILERVLDRGLVIVGDIRISLLDIELLTVKLRLLIASVDTARQLGIDWWEHDPWLSSTARPAVRDASARRDELPAGGYRRELAADDAAGGRTEQYRDRDEVDG